MNTFLLWGDVIIVAVIWTSFTVLYRKGKLSKPYWQLFWIGAFLGSLWEFPLYFAGPEFSDFPAYSLLVELPFHPVLIPVSHSVWDGGLFMLGLSVIKWLTPKPHFEKFSAKELFTFSIYGCLSAILIEIIGSFGIWEYIPTWWNPEIFKVNDRSITALAPLTWIVVPVIHYRMAVYLIAKKEK